MPLTCHFHSFISETEFSVPLFFHLAPHDCNLGRRVFKCYLATVLFPLHSWRYRNAFMCRLHWGLTSGGGSVSGDHQPRPSAKTGQLFLTVTGLVGWQTTSPHRTVCHRHDHIGNLKKFLCDGRWNKWVLFSTCYLKIIKRRPSDNLTSQCLIVLLS